jgi:uncharacterized protein YxjI
MEFKEQAKTTAQLSRSVFPFGSPYTLQVKAGSDALQYIAITVCLDILDKMD